MENNERYTPLNPNFFSDNNNQFLNNISTSPIVYKKRNINLIVLMFIVPILLISLIIFFLVSSNKKIVWLPNYIPDGFKAEGDVQVQIINNKEAYVSGYSNPAKGELVFTQQADPEFKCKNVNPNLSNFTDYKVFDINGIEACAITGFGKDRVYNWVNGSNRFTLKAKNLSISDTEFTKIASSLNLQKVKIVNVK